MYDAPPDPPARSLRPAPPAPVRPHRYERLHRRALWVAVGGRWVLAFALARTQAHQGGPWRYQLEYLEAPGSRVTHLFWGEADLMRPAE